MLIHEGMIGAAAGSAISLIILIIGNTILSLNLPNITPIGAMLGFSLGVLWPVHSYPKDLETPTKVI